LIIFKSKKVWKNAVKIERSPGHQIDCIQFKEIIEGPKRVYQLQSFIREKTDRRQHDSKNLERESFQIRRIMILPGGF
jgi:hypothetical protein